MRYSSCVTDTPLKLLVAVLDDRPVSHCRYMCCLLDRVMPRSNRVLSCCLLSSVYRLVCSWGHHRRCCERAIDFTFGTRLINRQGLCITYNPFYYNHWFAF